MHSLDLLKQKETKKIMKCFGRLLGSRRWVMVLLSLSVFQSSLHFVPWHQAFPKDPELFIFLLYKAWQPSLLNFMLTGQQGCVRRSCSQMQTALMLLLFLFGIMDSGGRIKAPAAWKKTVRTYILDLKWNCEDLKLLWKWFPPLMAINIKFIFFRFSFSENTC